jgi:hypothetical protein
MWNFHPMRGMGVVQGAPLDAEGGAVLDLLGLAVEQPVLEPQLVVGVVFNYPDIAGFVCRTDIVVQVVQVQPQRDIR